jgi:redox-sensitive bicupin YhaK (pirin superfamily)
MTIKHIITPREKDLGEFSVRRVLPYAKQRMVGPWIFFDHMGPADFAAGTGVNVRPHPHINLATVTYLFEGEILHRDSLGSVQTIRPGDINLMVAGKGITHSERERDEVNQVPHRLHGLQLWHALPEEDEECEPAFYHYPSEDLPRFTEGGVPVRVMMGTAYGFTSPVKIFAETLYAEAHMKAGDSLPLPEAEELAVYVASGSVTMDGQQIPHYSMAVLEPDSQVTLHAPEDSRIAIIGGGKMNERYIEWNFISSRKERIEQAKADWREGRFPKVPGDEAEFIPLPE